MMQVMNEIWKQYKDTNYEVSNLGNVRNIKTKRVLKPCKTPDGYFEVYLHKDGKRKYKLVHRLVAEVFIPNHQNLPQINHRDEDKTNNTVENLEWCTAEYNLNYGTRIKKLSKPVLQLRMDGSLVRIWSSTAEVQRQLHYSSGNISMCCNGKYKQAYGYKWCYAKQ